MYSWGMVCQSLYSLIPVYPSVSQHILSHQYSDRAASHRIAPYFIEYPQHTCSKLLILKHIERRELLRVDALQAQDQRTVFQKLREAALAYHLTRKWSKQKILTEYLNSIYFGNGAYGIEAAVRTYFGDGDEPNERAGADDAGVRLDVDGTERFERWDRVGRGRVQVEFNRTDPDSEET